VRGKGARGYYKYHEYYKEGTKFGDVDDGDDTAERKRRRDKSPRIGGWDPEGDQREGTGEIPVADLSPRPRHLCRGKAHSRTPTYSAFVRALSRQSIRYSSNVMSSRDG